MASQQHSGPLAALDLVNLTPLMALTSGRPDIVIGLLDGPVAMTHADLATGHIREIPGMQRGTCERGLGRACGHGTFSAGILSAKRGSPAPAICPDCTLLVRSIFSGVSTEQGRLPSATPAEVAAAIMDCIRAGARVINLSAAYDRPSVNSVRELQTALDFAAQRDVIIVAAAGNQGTLGSSVITRHRAVIPVAARNRRGLPMHESNMGASIGSRGLGAPGEGVTSLSPDGEAVVSGGTSVAAPFVTGAIGLLWAQCPRSASADVRRAIGGAVRRTAVTPPLLDAWAAYQTLSGRSRC